MGDLRTVVWIFALCAWSFLAAAQSPCESMQGAEPTKARQQSLRDWLGMLEQMTLAGHSGLLGLDPELASEEDVQHICRLAGEADLDACASGRKTVVWVWHGHQAALGAAGSRQWLVRAATLPRSRVAAGALQVAIGMLDASAWLQRVATWDDAEHQAAALRALVALDPDPALLPKLDRFIGHSQGQVRLPALVLRDHLGAPDFAGELVLIRDCRRCARALGSARGPWTLLAQAWTSLDRHARVDALHWTRWTPEAMAWAATASPAWEPAAIKALLDAVDASPGMSPDQTRSLRLRWLHAVAQSGIDPLGPVPIGDDVVDKESDPAWGEVSTLIEETDASGSEAHAVLAALTRHRHPAIALFAAKRLQAGGHRGEPETTLARIYGHGPLPLWVLQQLWSGVPDPLAPQMLATVSGPQPRSVCTAMRLSADLLAEQQPERLRHLLRQSVAQVLFHPQGRPLEWHTVMARILWWEPEAEFMPIAAPACIVRHGAVALRAAGQLGAEDWLAATRGREDTAAHLVRAWILSGSADPAFADALAAVQRAGSDALAQEAEVLADRSEEYPELYWPVITEPEP